MNAFFATDNSLNLPTNQAEPAAVLPAGAFINHDGSRPQYQNRQQQQSPMFWPAPSHLSDATLWSTAVDGSCNGGGQSQHFGSAGGGLSDTQARAQMLAARNKDPFLPLNAQSSAPDTGSSARRAMTTSINSQSQNFALNPSTAALALGCSASVSPLSEQCPVLQFQQSGRETNNEKLLHSLLELHRCESLTILAARNKLCMEAKQSELQSALHCNAELQKRLQYAEANSRLWSEVAMRGSVQFHALRAKFKQATSPTPRDSQGSCVVKASGDNGKISADFIAPTAAAADQSPFDGVSGAFDDDKRTMMSAACRVCCSGSVASVVLFPCRHLCVCAACDDAGRVLVCPVCGVPKTASVHVAPAPCLH